MEGMKSKNGIGLTKFMSFSVMEKEDGDVVEVKIPLTVIAKSKILTDEKKRLPGPVRCIKGFSESTVKAAVKVSERALEDVPCHLGKAGLLADEALQLIRFAREYQFTPLCEELWKHYHHHYFNLRLAVLDTDMELKNISVSSMGELIRRNSPVPFKTELDLLKCLFTWLEKNRNAKNLGLENWEAYWEVLKHVKFDSICPVSFAQVVSPIKSPTIWKDEMNVYYTSQLYDPKTTPDIGFRKEAREQANMCIFGLLTAKGFSKYGKRAYFDTFSEDWEEHSSTISLDLKKSVDIHAICLFGTQLESDFMKASMQIRSLGPTALAPKIIQTDQTLLEIYSETKIFRAREDQPLIIQVQPPIRLALKTKYLLVIRCEQSGKSLYARSSSGTIITDDETLNLSLESSSRLSTSQRDSCLTTKFHWISYSIAS